MADDSRAMQVRELVSARFGPVIDGPRRMAFGHRSQTYRVRCATGADLIVRTNDDPGVYAGTVHTIGALARLGLPVPRVVDVDLSGGSAPFAWMILETVPGVDLRFALPAMTQGQMSAVAERIVHYQRVVGGLPHGDGYGFAPLGAGGPHTSWADAVRADRGPVDRRDRAIAELSDAVDAALDGAAGRISRLPARCFLDDLTIKNVIVDTGRLQGIIDLDVVCYGDPMYWLALTQVAVIADLDPPTQHYADELMRLWRPSDVERRNFALWCAVHATEFLNAGLPVERRAVLFDRARRWLTDA